MHCVSVLFLVIAQLGCKIVLIGEGNCFKYKEIGEYLKSQEQC